MEIIVMTCDKSYWVLPIFLHLFGKFWADCPWPMTIVGGPETPDFGGIGVYRGEDAAWCNLLLEYLADKDDDDFVSIFCEDYVIMDYVDTNRVNACLKIIQADPSVQFIRLNAVPGPRLPWIPGLKVGRFDKEKASYLSSLVPGFWRMAHLRRLLEPTWSAWDVEIHGSEKARTLPGIFLGSTETLVPCHNFLLRGRINPAAVKEVREKW